MLRLVSILSLSVLLAPGTARADLPPPSNITACEGAQVDAPCQFDQGPGRCVAARCNKLDYSKGSPPQSIEYDCLRCESSPAPATTPTASPAPTSAPPSPASEPPSVASRCAVDGATGLVAALVGLGGLLRRRR